MMNFHFLDKVKYKKLSMTLLLIIVLQTFCIISVVPPAFGWVFWKYKTDGKIVDVGVSADGKYIVAGTENGGLFLLDSNGSLLWTHHFSVEVKCAAISGDGNRVAVGILEYLSGKPDIYLFDNLGNITWQKDLVEGSWPYDVALSPDGQYIAAGDTDNIVYLYDINGNLKWTYTAGGWVSAVSVSSEGEYIAAGSWDDSLYFFNKTGDLLWSHKFEYSVDAVSVSPEGEYVAAGSSTAEDMFLFDKDENLVLQTQFYICVNAVSISANAERIAVGSYKNFTVIDKAANTMCERETDKQVESVALTADGKFVAFSCEDYTYFLEALPLSEITCEISTSEMAFGESITVSGYASPLPAVGTNITLTYTMLDGSNLTRTASTDQSGFYSDTFTPTSAGEWTVQASWMGDEQHAPSESPSQPFTVGRSEIACDIFPELVFLGDSVAVNGSINPSVSSVEVTFTYKLFFQNSTWKEEGFVNVTRSVVTLADGSFSDVFTPSQEGRWKAIASWAGDTQHMGSKTEAYFDVNPADEINLISENPVTLYWRQKTWYCSQRFPSSPPESHSHYSMDIDLPTSNESTTVGFNPGRFIWFGHPEWGYWGVHTGRLSTSIVVEKGLWKLSIWASAREPDQHFIVRLCIWDEDHNTNQIASWNSGEFNSTDPETPKEFIYYFDRPSTTIPEGSCLGFVIAVGPDSDVKWFFDSTLHPSFLEIPPSTELVDESSPGIGNPVQYPLNDIRPGEDVTVTVKVTDPDSGVSNATLWYSIDDSAIWTPLDMIRIDADTYQATVRGYENGTWISYKIIAYDNAGNQAVNDSAGDYYVYHVVPEFSSILILSLFMMATLLAAIIYRRRKC